VTQDVQAIHRIDETAHELVVVKPAGLPTELPRDPAADSVVRRLSGQGFSGLRLVHRLDTPTCGVLLVARSPEAAAYYGAEIAGRRWHKWYVARVATPPAEAARLMGTHKAYLKTEGRTARVVRSGGKPSFLDIVNVAPSPGRRGSDLLIRLHTGRFHQIRAMLAHLRSPIEGDMMYSGPPAESMYLEQVVLGARPFASESWRVWTAPPHADRPAWHADLAAAVAALSTRPT
jgi:23S rRNA-/tRNA-specific pseudouridylate synthase